MRRGEIEISLKKILCLGISIIGCPVCILKTVRAGKMFHEHSKKAIFALKAAVFSLLMLFPMIWAFSKDKGIPRSSTAVLLEVPAKYRTGPFAAKRYLTAPPGFRVSVFASGLNGVRFLAADDKGRIYASIPSEGSVIVMPDRDNDGVADEVTVFASGLNRPHGLAFAEGGLIVAETGRLILLKDTRGGLKADFKRVITEDIPEGGAHWTRTVAVGPDGGFYVSAGSDCNSCVESDRRRAAILRFSPAGGGAYVYATGLRNSVGIAFHPETKELWGVDNGRDLLGDDLPPEELNKIAEGGDYGWPYCYGDRTPDSGLGSTGRCRDTAAPAVMMQAHCAPLGIAFGKGLKFRAEYRDVLYVAFHGSWNRTIPTGYKLVAIPFKEGKPAGQPVDFITGWLVEGKAWGRPVDPLVGHDGALYLSDDYAGAIYRITEQR